MNRKESNTQWGFISPDGFFQPVSTLTSFNLEYACKSLAELHAALDEKIALEHYEECALIRDEIIKRQ